jgi:hypothetical protein
VSATLVTQHAKRMRRTLSSPVTYWLYHVFPHYRLTGTIVGTRVTEHKMFVLIFSKTFV